MLDGFYYFWLISRGIVIIKYNKASQALKGFGSPLHGFLGVEVQMLQSPRKRSPNHP